MMIIKRGQAIIRCLSPFYGILILEFEYAKREMVAR